MFDIEKALADIKTIPQQPSERLRESTRQCVIEEIRKKQSVKRLSQLAWALPVVAAMLAAFVFLFTLPPAADEVSFITIDINPSISMQVNTSGEVLAVSAENDDASVLLKSLNLSGIQFEDALKVVVRMADEQGYLKENGHVLVACFGGTANITQQVVETAVAESTGREVKVLLLQSTKEEYQNAKNSNHKPGVELLKVQALKKGIEEQNIDEIIDQMRSVEKGNAPDTSPQSQKNEIGTPAASNNQSEKDNNKNDNGQNQQTSDGENGKDVKENAAPSAPQDKPKDTGNGKNNGHADNAADKNKESGNNQNGKSTTADPKKNKKT